MSKSAGLTSRLHCSLLEDPRHVILPHLFSFLICKMGS